MYTRTVSAPPEKLIKNGKPEFGTFVGNVGRLDIRGVEKPFSEIALPHFISNFRIKSTLTFYFCIGDYTGTIEFFDFKVFGYAEIVFWSKSSARKLAYRAFMGPRKRFIPHNVENGFCVSFSKTRYIRISWDHQKDRVAVLFNMKGDSIRPSARGAFTGPLSAACTSEVCSVIPAPTKRRCSATYTANLFLRGSISLGETKSSAKIPGEDTSGYGIFTINRTYYNLRTILETVCAAGKIGEDEFSFHIFSSDENAVDTDSLNANHLVVNGDVTPLPPVTVTYPMGMHKKWVIQDFENMVDLTFTPKAMHIRDMRFFVIHAQTRTLLGTFEGVIKTKNGKDIVLHEFEGFAKHQLMRL